MFLLTLGIGLMPTHHLVMIPLLVLAMMNHLRHEAKLIILLCEIFSKSARNPQFSINASRLTIQVSQGNRRKASEGNENEGR